MANSLLYDRNHLPRTAPAPDCVQRALAAGQQHARPAEGGAAAAPKQPAGAALQPAAAP